MLLDTTSAIRTPERVRFRHQVAGPGRRALAWGVDALLQGMVLVGIGVVSLVVGGEGWGMGMALAGTFLVTWFYGAAFEILWSGRTPGKFVLGLRVVTETGAPATPLQLVLRNLLRGVDFLPVAYGVGVLAMLVDPALRRIGDLVAGTIVADEQQGEMLAAVVLEPPVTEEERRQLPPRVDLSRDELDALEVFLRRRGDLSPGRVEELARMVEPVLERLHVDADSPDRGITLAYARATGRDRSLDGGEG